MEQNEASIIRDIESLIIAKQNERFIAAMHRWCKADSAKTVVAEDILQFMARQKIFDLRKKE